MMLNVTQLRAAYGESEALHGIDLPTAEQAGVHAGPGREARCPV